MSDYTCPICENIYSDEDDAVSCCANQQPERDETWERERYDDDGRDYADPGDFLKGYES